MSLTDWIPEPLHSPGPWDLAYWQWIAIALLLVIAVVFARIARWLFSWGLKKVVHRTVTTFDDDLVDRLGGPLRLLGTVGLFRLGMPLLELPAERAQTITNILLAVLAFGIVWGLLRAIDVIIGHASKAAWVATRPTSRSLLSLVGRIMKVVVVVIAIISALGTMGLPVGSLLAGLGIGGIALAFGAQKTVENLFGAVALGVDQPLREGDFVKVEDSVLGTVEAIGLRSTRVRTLDRTVVTLPNGRISEMRIETFAARDRIRFATTIGLVYGTTAAQMRQVLEGIERLLREHPKQFDSTEITVRFLAFGQSSLDVEVISMFATSEISEFRAIRQELLLGIMDVVEKAGSSFAFPTRTVHLASLPAKAA
ncbi:MAG: mechanosensitive ion channel family protein [Deltaproteobacteria bacterium]|nr:mechanosensitive ion channel family protein [Deltaproteobacteria bacterium]